MAELEKLSLDLVLREEHNSAGFFVVAVKRINVTGYAKYVMCKHETRLCCLQVFYAIYLIIYVTM